VGIRERVASFTEDESLIINGFILIVDISVPGSMTSGVWK